MTMVFWKTLSWSYLAQSFFVREPFASLVFEPTADLSLPAGVSIKRITSSVEEKEKEEIKRFLWTYFGEPPHKPRLVMEGDWIPTSDLALVLRNMEEEIIGFLRYHWIGQFRTALSTPDIYSVDCFCIHPQWRKKGLGDVLLTELQRYANETGKYYATFLREGPSLSIFHRPAYSGEYAYRSTPLDGTRSPHVYRLTPSQIQKAIQMYQTMYPKTWIVWNPDTTNQQWFLYQRNSCYVWVCIQSAHQQIQTEKYGNLRMGWMTAWLESPELSDPFRAEACLALTHRINHGFDAIWVDHKWTGGSPEWKRDGMFHFYTYQWSSNQTIGISYCMTQ